MPLFADVRGGLELLTTDALAANALFECPRRRVLELLTTAALTPNAPLLNLAAGPFTKSFLECIRGGRHQAIPASNLRIVRDAGHSDREPGIIDALIYASKEISRQGLDAC